MASRIYPAEQAGHRYEFTTRRQLSHTAMQATIGRNRTEPILTFSLDPTALKRIRLSFQPLPIGERASVRYQVISRDGLARMGFVFEFEEASMVRSIFIAADAMEWLMT